MKFLTFALVIAFLSGCTSAPKVKNSREEFKKQLTGTNSKHRSVASVEEDYIAGLNFRIGSGVSCMLDLSKVNGKNESVVFVDRVQGNCESGYSINIKGVGLGLRYSHNSDIEIACTSKDPRGTYYGVKAEVAAALGLGVGVFASDDGLCILASSSVLAIGANLNGVKLVIKSRKK